MFQTSGLVIHSAGLTDPGRIRAINQDAFWIDPQGELFLLADGMGGHAAGDVASQLAVELFRQAWRSARSTRLAPAELLEQAILETQAGLRERGRRDPQLHRMGTTFLAAYRPTSSVLWLIHVGDSRAYRLRKNRLRQLTEDHTVYNQVRKSRHVAGEIINPSLMHQLSQSLGSSEFIAPQIVSLKLEPTDRYLLCTDGLPDMLTEVDIADLLGVSGQPEQICHSLIDAANQRGGKDNITVIVLDYRG